MVAHLWLHGSNVKELAWGILLFIEIVSHATHHPVHQMGNRVAAWLFRRTPENPLRETLHTLVSTQNSPICEINPNPPTTTLPPQS